jgi:hypothetical protein
LYHVHASTTDGEESVTLTKSIERVSLFFISAALNDPGWSDVVRDAVLVGVLRNVNPSDPPMYGWSGLYIQQMHADARRYNVLRTKGYI